jgi:hypothetical protein
VTPVTTMPTTLTRTRRLSNLAILLLCNKAVLPLHKLEAPIPTLRTGAIKTTLLCGTLLWLPNSKVASRLKVSSVEVDRPTP